MITTNKIEALFTSLARGRSILLEEIWNSPKAYLAERAAREFNKNILILTGNNAEEARLYHDFAYFGPTPVYEYPAWETLPSENIAPSPDIVGERYEILRRLKEEKFPHIILSSLQACLQKLMAPEDFVKLNVTLTVGMKLPFEQFQIDLAEMGFKKVGIAADKGEFAVRGGIIDLYPVSSPDPFRLEFFGDELESIRTYDPIAQRSKLRVEKIHLTPATELEMINQAGIAQKPLASLLDYLGDDTIIIIDDILALEDRWTAIKALLDPALVGASTNFSTLPELFDAFERKQKIFIAHTPIRNLSDIQIKDDGQIVFEAFGRSYLAERHPNPFATTANFLFINDEPILEALSGREIELKFLCSNDAEEETLKKKIHDLGVQLPLKTSFEKGYLSEGFALPECQLLILPMAELTERYKIRRQKQRSAYHSTSNEMFSLQPGECVVHYNNGIGKYLGTERKGDLEYFLIEYADQAKLWVPFTQAHLISKYIGATEETPKLHTLGSSKWRHQKEKTQTAILSYASDLLKIYAEREVKGGFIYREDSDETISFEEEFPFVETEDQLRAIADIKQDMTTSKAMDRLVCGDVGYGKTEVAMRAALKAVMDGDKQVAVLVPTTVLAMQHYENFVKRMANFPVNISVLSRFRTAKEVKETLKGLEQGSVDIVVGTHRIISKDVHFKNLGLIIIDEEQRFGVKAKEHLKKMKTGVDCLTLSATPIPRTLYMSLIGARDMSVISTPPQDRLPIKTILTEQSDQLLKTAIQRELAREGQVYFIHNRVETIFSIASKIKELVPDAKVVVGHGQMSSHELDEVFHAFKSGRANVLVATTIVENGIDIPNANTILIDRADHFGLADLYQLRGRVGRWNRRAYAYFLVKNSRSMSEISRKRLLALAETSGYGGGMRLAMKDLEIRGAGNILGEEQSGQVAIIGFHLYCKLLNRTILSLQGKVPSVVTDTKIEIPVDAKLPESYVNDMSLRMEFYQRLGEALSFQEVDAVFEELKDRFGKPSLQAQWLYHFTRVRIFGSLNGFMLIKSENKSLLIERKKGKTSETKRFLFVMPQNPKTFEEKLLSLLKKEYFI